MRGLSDTSPEAERVLIEAYRRMPVSTKWQQMGSIYRTARLLHAAGLRRRNPRASDEAIRDDWLARTLDRELLAQVREAIRARGRR